MNSKIRELKVGFIGAGKHASANLYPSLNLLGVPVQCISTRTEESAEKAKKEHFAERAYNNYHAMLEQEALDAVLVSTSGDQHAGIVIDALKAGVNVFVEKPLGWTADEAGNVARVSEDTGKEVMVGFMKRHAPSYKLMKEIVRDEIKFGPIISMTGMFGMRSFGPKDEPYLKYGAIHYVDLIRYFFGEVKDLVGFKRTPSEGVSQIFSFLTESGVIGNMFFGGLPAWSRHYEEIVITGAKGFVKTENMRNVIVHLDSVPKTEKPRWQIMDEKDEVYYSIETSSSGGWQTLFMNGYVDELEHFLDCVVSGKKPVSSASENAKTMALCDKIVKELKSSI